MLNRPDINVPVYDIKELSTGSMKTSNRNQLLLLFQTEGVVEPHLVKKKHITEAVSDHVSNLVIILTRPSFLLLTLVLVTILSWLQDSYHLTWILTVPTPVTQNHTPLVVHPTSLVIIWIVRPFVTQKIIRNMSLERCIELEVVDHSNRLTNILLVKLYS